MTFKSFDGKEIYIHEWTEVEKPRGVVQIVHGMAEHAARYEPFARFLNDRGFIVLADDHRGHGLTDPKSLGYCKGDMFGDILRDEAAITDDIRSRYPGLPNFIFGFSFGSFVTQAYIGRYGDKVRGAVIGGSSYKKDFDVYLGTAVAGLMPEKAPAKLIDSLTFGAYAKSFPDGKWISADPENNAAYEADPFCGFVCSARFYRDFFWGLRNLYTPEYAAGLPRDLPVLLISGAQDPVGDMGAGVKKLRDYYESAGMKNVSMRLFEGSRHEFLNEKADREAKWGELLKFFERNLG